MSRWGRVLRGAVFALVLGSGTAWSQPGNAWESVSRGVFDIGVHDSLLVGADGTVWGWGRPYSHELGPVPVPVEGLPDAVAVSSSGMHSLALLADGTVWAWGVNFYGQLGNGNFGYDLYYAPAPVLGLTDVVAISAGPHHSLALRADGSVWAWGANYYGQLGVGAEYMHFRYLRPVKVEGFGDVVAISAGYDFSLALRADGTVWGSGANGSGQLGQEGGLVSSPVQVPGISEVKRIEAGRNSSLAVREDGTLWAWGHNNAGQLGDGTTTDRRSPVRVGDLTDILDVSSTGGHSLALERDGTVWAWGYNSDGQLGDGTTTLRLSPVRVPGLDHAVAIGAGELHSQALLKDGTVWGWGWNYLGSLGDGTTQSRLSPTRALLPCRFTGLPSLDNRELAPRECHGAP